MTLLPIRAAAGLWAGLLLGLSACAEPQLQIEARPPGLRVYHDGRLLPPKKDAPLTRPLSYYGTAEISARQDIVRGVEPLAAELRKVPVPPPVSPWLFPLDFVLEVLSYPFAGDRYTQRVELELQALDRVPEGSRPAGIEALRQRAAAARIAR